MELNEKLLSLRKKNKLTQAQVSETLDVSRQAISNWETGAVLPSTDNLLALSRLYQVPLDHLLNGDTDLTPAPAKEKEVDKVTGQSYEKIGHTSDALEYFVCELLKALIKYLD